MSAAYDKALKRKEEIEDNLRKLSYQIELLERELSEISVFLDVHNRFSRGTEPENIESERRGPWTEATTPAGDTVFYSTPTDSEREGRSSVIGYSADRARGNPAAIAALAEGILKDNQRPMTRGELANEIERRGGALPGNEKAVKAKYVGTILWRERDRFINEGGGYWLKNVPLPGGGKIGEFDLTGKLGS